jgi:O-6-methylguanine DNA methyltransferase
MKEKIRWFSFESPLGTIHVAEVDGKIAQLTFSDPMGEEFFAWLKKKFPDASIEDAGSLPGGMLGRAKKQVMEFLSGKRKAFELPLMLVGTDFQKKVWEAMAGIPWGETWSYGDLAREAGWPGAARAVGGACHKNPIPLIIPCHRVIGADGKMVGFGSGGVGMKKRLLEIES